MATKTTKKCNYANESIAIGIDGKCHSAAGLDPKLCHSAAGIDPKLCHSAAGFNPDEKETINYGFYSKVLQKPFDSLSELKAAEDVYYAEQKAKADKTAQKKADAQKVEDTFKALNAARKAYKEDLTQLTKDYAESLENLKKAYELGKKDIRDTLAAAEDAHEKALKEFTSKYPEGYHLTLKDGDFEKTISSKVTTNSNTKATDISKNVIDIFDLLFGTI